MTVIRWKRKLYSVRARLRALADDIDDLGETGAAIAQPDAMADPDTIACFASNSLQGTLALLRDLEARVRGGIVSERGP